MPLLSDIAGKKKIKYFFKEVPKDDRILEVGSGSGWLKGMLDKEGYTRYEGLDIVPPADYVGDIRKWRELGLEEASYDVIVAFEVVEHVHCFKEMHELLKPDGKLFLTSPVPHMDWIMKILEAIGMNQKRTSPHDHLIYFKKIPFFKLEKYKTPGFLAQWGIFSKKGEKPA